MGRFGPYIQHQGKFVSIPKQFDPLTITREEVIELIQTKREEEAKAELKTFAEDPTLSIRMGRFGAFLKHGKDNYKLSKEQKEKAEQLSYKECLGIMEKGTPTGTKKGSTTKKTTRKAKK